MILDDEAGQNLELKFRNVVYQEGMAAVNGGCRCKRSERADAIVE